MAVSTIPASIKYDKQAYDQTGQYHILVTTVDYTVTVSGVVFGTGNNEYLMGIKLPSPAMYVDGSTEYLANAIVFQARNQLDGSYVTLRAGSDFYLYLSSQMVSGKPYAFSFSYNKK